MFHLKKKEQREVKRITEYLVSGGAFFWSGYIVFLALNWFLGPALLWVSSSVSYVVGWAVNYLLQRYWVFDNPLLTKHEIEVTARYILISLVNLVLNCLIIWYWEILGYRIEFGPFVAAAFFTIWNFLWYRYWVFPTKFPRKAMLTDNKRLLGAKR